jgi:hypothetical protein
MPSRTRIYPMNRFLKTLMLWLLLAALPLQGIAAAMQTTCGPMEHGGLAEATMSVHLHEHGGDALDAGDTVATDTGAAVKSAMSHDTSPDDSHDHATCSACASCCVGAVAAPPAAVVTPAYGSSLPSAVAPVPLVTGFVPAGLERPPKRITT